MADVTASELVMGGIYYYVEVFANNHRTRCRISPVSVLDVYIQATAVQRHLSRGEDQLERGMDSSIARGRMELGYGRELRNFVECAREGRTPESDIELALDVTLTIYAGYVSAEEMGREVEVRRV